MSGALERAQRFADMHAGPELFVMANPTSVGVAQLLEGLGCKAFGTSSSALAFAHGQPDGQGRVSRAQSIAHAVEIAASTTVPISGDFENGYGDSPDDVATTVRDAIEAGLAGCCIEDSTSTDRGPIYEAGLATDRIRAGAEAVGDHPFVLVARAENFLHGRPDLAATIERLQSFEAAGADAVYAPGLNSLEEIRTVVDSVGVPVNVLVGRPGQEFTLADLAEIGVRRVSVGGNFMRVANQAITKAATALLGTPTSLGPIFEG